MHAIIAPSFFHKKICVLPGIGKLVLVTKSAESDFANQLVDAPRQQIVFTPGAQHESLFNEFSAISDLMKRKLDETGSVNLAGIGIFNKTADNKIEFEPVLVDEDLLFPVTAPRVVRENAPHAILVGDKETTSVEMTEFLSDEEEKPSKPKWWLWAIVLGAIGLSLLALYIYQYGINDFSSSLPF